MATNYHTDEGSVVLLHNQLKTASWYSGIRCRPSVLLLHENLGDECLADVCTFLKDGIITSCISPSDVTLLNLLNGLFCANVLLRNYSLTHSLSLQLIQHKVFELMKLFGAVVN